MQGLYSGFDAARASWEFPEGTSAGFLGYPSDPVSDGLESTTGDGTQATLDNDHDTAVKVRDDYSDDLTWPDLTWPLADLFLRCWSGRSPDQLGRRTVARQTVRQRYRQPAGRR